MEKHSTSLSQKLGLDHHGHQGVLHAPEGYSHLLAEYYSAMSTKLSGTFDWLQAFYTEKSALQDEFPILKNHLTKSGQLWISWPKKSSGMGSDLTDNIIRKVGVENGLIDVKVVAIDDVWSGLKFVYRVKDR
jgi:hypothetical protein